MAYQVIPTTPIPFQTLTVLLANNRVRVDLYQKSTGMFCDLYLDDTLITGGVPCQVGNPIVRSAYQGFPGNIAFFDLHVGQPPLIPEADPGDVYYTGLGTRYFLAYSDVSAPV